MNTSETWNQVHGPRGVGVAFYPLDPKPEMVHLETIAHGLSLENRFASQTETFWPVAMHCYHGSLAITDPEIALYFCFHDAAEGLGWRDMPSPIKRRPEMAWYRAQEEKILAAVAVRFDLPPKFWKHEDVRKQDEHELYYDQMRKMQRPPIDWGVWKLSTLVREAYGDGGSTRVSEPKRAKELWLGRVAMLFAATGRAQHALEAIGALNRSMAEDA